MPTHWTCSRPRAQPTAASMPPSQRSWRRYASPIVRRPRRRSTAFAIASISTDGELPSSCRTDKTLRSTLVSTNRELEAAFKGQGHRAEPIGRILDKVKVLPVCLAKLQRVVRDDDRALAQMGCDQRERWASHRRPDVNEHEV